jgi:hypothetical protein
MADGGRRTADGGQSWLGGGHVGAGNCAAMGHKGHEGHKGDGRGIPTASSDAGSLAGCYQDTQSERCKPKPRCYFWAAQTYMPSSRHNRIPLPLAPSPSDP